MEAEAFGGGEVEDIYQGQLGHWYKISMICILLDVAVNVP